MLLLSVLLLMVLLLLLWEWDRRRTEARALLRWCLWLRDSTHCCELPPVDSMLLDAAAKV
jgi:hypothetical protein